MIEQKNIITGGYTGRMGNQMFQIASVIGVALKHNALYTFQRAGSNDAWKIYFNHFPEIPIDRDNCAYHNEHPYRYEPIPYTGGQLCLCGYYQSYKYFQEYRKEIIEAFGLKWDPNKGRSKVAVHIRRGDYKEGSPFEPVTIDYIINAMRMILEKTTLRHFVFLSDDPHWCIENLMRLKIPNVTFEFPDIDYVGDTEKNVYDDMEYGSSCEHQILSPSTYSWWMAWLNQNPNKMVIVPKLETWFNGVNEDLLPEEWIQI